jgi:lipoyl(octanoyl) transferase
MIQYLYFGRMDYGDALRLQEEMVALRAADRIGNVLLLLEHPPVLTLGRNARRANILASDEMLAARGVTVHEINRGGDVTYHGPGQLIGYPIFDLRSLHNAKGARPGPVDFVRMMEEALIRLCGEFGVAAGRIGGLTGVWVGLTTSSAHDEPNSAQPRLASKKLPPPGRERKIAAIGIHVSRGITSHGFAFNVTTNLGDFRLINPCGITDRPVTSLACEVPDAAALPGLEALAHCAAREFGAVFGEPAEMVESLAALRAKAQATADGVQTQPASGPPAQEFPAEDTPLQAPPAVERLRGSKSRPIQA